MLCFRPCQEEEDAYRGHCPGRRNAKHTHTEFWKKAMLEWRCIQFMTPAPEAMQVCGVYLGAEKTPFPRQRDPNVRVPKCGAREPNLECKQD